MTIESKQSQIHGYGWFTTEDLIETHLIILPGQTHHGYNSSCEPNVELFPLKYKLKKDKKGYVKLIGITNRPIKAGEELTVSYVVNKCNCEKCRDTSIKQP